MDIEQIHFLRLLPILFLRYLTLLNQLSNISLVTLIDFPIFSEIKFSIYLSFALW